MSDALEIVAMDPGPRQVPPPTRINPRLWTEAIWWRSRPHSRPFRGLRTPDSHGTTEQTWPLLVKHTNRMVC